MRSPRAGRGPRFQRLAGRVLRSTGVGVATTKRGISRTASGPPARAWTLLRRFRRPQRFVGNGGRRGARSLPRAHGLVPRVLEARGLDVTPGMIAKLRSLGDRHRGHFGSDPARGDRARRGRFALVPLAAVPAKAASIPRCDLASCGRIRAREPARLFNHEARIAAGFETWELEVPVDLRGQCPYLDLGSPAWDVMQFHGDHGAPHHAQMCCTRTGGMLIDD